MRFPVVIFTLPCRCTVEQDMFADRSVFLLRDEENDCVRVSDMNLGDHTALGVIECPHCGSTFAAVDYVEWVNGGIGCSHLNVGRCAYGLFKFGDDFLEVVDKNERGVLVRERPEIDGGFRPTFMRVGGEKTLVAMPPDDLKFLRH